MSESTRDRVIRGVASYPEARDFIEKLEARSYELDRLRKAYARLAERLRLATPHSLMEVSEAAPQQPMSEESGER